jgi:hypothetical protein
MPPYHHTLKLLTLPTLYGRGSSSRGALSDVSVSDAVAADEVEPDATGGSIGAWPQEDSISVKQKMMTRRRMTGGVKVGTVYRVRACLSKPCVAGLVLTIG